MYEHDHVLAYKGVKDSPYHTSRLSWPALFAIPFILATVHMTFLPLELKATWHWGWRSFALCPYWWMKQDLNLRTRLFRGGAESAQLLHPSKLTPVCAKRLVFSISFLLHASSPLVGRRGHYERSTPRSLIGWRPVRCVALTYLVAICVWSYAIMLRN